MHMFLFIIPHESFQASRKCNMFLHIFMLFNQDAAWDILRNAPGTVVIDDRAANHFPAPLELSNRHDVAVGRIRSDVSQDGNYG